MNYNNIFNNSISQLGMGFTAHKNNTQEMVDKAISCGMNYFEVATFYLNGKCEEIAGQALSKYNRNQFFLCDKLCVPHLKDNPTKDYLEDYFNDQLNKCQVDYFDVYLLQGLNSNHLKYLEKFPIVLDFLIQKKEEGKIHNLGFSFHDNLDVLKTVVSLYDWDVAQIQINFFDWYAGQAKKLYDYLTDLKIPIIAMEPCKGGNLLRSTPIDFKKKMLEEFPNKNFYSLSLTFLQQLDNIKIILTGAANISELSQNIMTINYNFKYSKLDKNLCLALIKTFQKYNYIPCTSCNYCKSVCPKDIRIPEMFLLANNILLDQDKYNSWKQLMNITKISGHSFYQCINCHKCEEICPQQLPITKLFFGVVKQLEG